MKNKPFTPEQFKTIYSQVPRLTVNLIIKMNGGIILTLRSLPSWRNQWHMPGGMLFYKETIPDAVVRIAQDELAISVRILKPIGYIEYPSEEKERGFGYTVGLVMLCEATSADITINEEASKADIFTELPPHTIEEERVFMERHWNDILNASL